MNDPKNKQMAPMDMEDDFFDYDTVASATECTGLMPTPPLTKRAVDSYAEIYDVPLAKDDMQALTDPSLASGQTKPKHN